MNGQQFRLRTRLLDLGYSYLSSLEFWEGIRPILERLVNELGESSSVAVLDRTEIVYVARVQAKRIIAPTVSVGTRLPAFATAMGRVLLGGLSEAELDDYLTATTFQKFTPTTVCDQGKLKELVATARRDGYAYVDQELEVGLRSLAVPIPDRAGNIIAAMNTSMHSSRADNETVVSDYLPRLRAGSDEASLMFR